MLETVLAILGTILVIATALPLIRRQAWWVRVFDFPRLQIAVGLALVLILHVLFIRHGTTAYAFRGVLLLCLFLQLLRMLPYTTAVKKQVQDSVNAGPGNHLRLLFANVLQSNRNGLDLLRMVQQTDPDVFLAIETDDWWCQALEGLAATHPYTLLQPQDNTYGMALFSRFELIDPEVAFLVKNEVPSFHAAVRLPAGCEVRLHCLHPRPPAPNESETSAERDAELLIVGKTIRQAPGPVIVMGDMNDVAWSHTSNLFRAISGLLDPRIGRGFFNTFNAKHWTVRFPLDHFFHSSDFRLVAFRRLPAFGSDHFPVYIHLSHEPEAQAAQAVPAADPEAKAEATEKIAKMTRNAVSQ